MYKYNKNINVILAMAGEDSDHDGTVSSGQFLSSDDACYTVDDIMNALKNSTGHTTKKNNNYKLSIDRRKQENNAIINIEDLECVVYDEAGVLKNVNDLCNYVINNEGYVENTNQIEDNDVNIVNLTDIIFNHDTLSLENCNVISSSRYDADDSVVHDKINSNDLSIGNICTGHSQTTGLNNNLSETETKQRKNIAEPKEWDRNK